MCVTIYILNIQIDAKIAFHVWNVNNVMFSNNCQ